MPFAKIASKGCESNVELGPMRIPIILAILATTTLGSTARADFVITSPPPAADPPVVPGPQPRMPAYPVHPTSTRFKIAYGFGHQVPLSFAVRQIVPPAITVTYRPGTDPTGGAARPGTASCSRQ